jgi:hypothetical protein
MKEIVLVNWRSTRRPVSLTRARRPWSTADCPTEASNTRTGRESSRSSIRVSFRPASRPSGTATPGTGYSGSASSTGDSDPLRDPYWIRDELFRPEGTARIVTSCSSPDWLTRSLVTSGSLIVPAGGAFRFA